MYNLELVTLDGIAATYDAAVVAVDHKQFAGIGPRLRAVVGQTGVIFDVKGTLAREVADGRL